MRKRNHICSGSKFALLKFLVVIAIIAIFCIMPLSAQNLLNNGELTVPRPVSEVAAEMRRLKVETDDANFPRCWMPASGNDQAVKLSYFDTAGGGKPNAIRLEIPGGKANLSYHHTRVSGNLMKAGHHFRPLLKGSGEAEIRFSMHVYDKDGKFLTTLKSLSMAKVTAPETAFPPFTLTEVKDAAWYVPFWQIDGRGIVIESLRLEEVDELAMAMANRKTAEVLQKPADFDREFTALSSEEKLTRLRMQNDVVWLLCAASDADPVVARMALQRLVLLRAELPDSALQTLTGLAGSANNYIRARASYLLGCMGERALPAIEVLTGNLTVANEGVVSSSAVALTRLGPKVYPKLRRLMIGENRSTRLSVALALRGMPGGVPAELREVVEWASPRVVQSGTSLHPNSSFEAGMDGWRVELHDGAEGDWAIDESRASSGRRSLRITKKNPLGYIKLVSTQPIIIPPDRNRKPWAFRTRFQCFDATRNANLIPRFEWENGMLQGDDGGGMNTYYAWTSQHMLRNTPPQYWDKRVIAFRPDANNERVIKLALILYGDPVTVYLDDIELPAAPWQKVDAGRIYAQPDYSREEMLDIVAKRPPVRVTVAAENQRTVVRVNGKPVIPALHMSWPTTGATADFREMAKAGVTFPLISLSMTGSMNFPPFGEAWNGRDEAIFEDFFASIEQALQQDPHGNFILGLNLMWPPDYVLRNPDEAWLNAKGHKGYGNSGHMLGFTEKLPEKRADLFWWPSQFSEKFLKDYGDFFRRFLIELKKKPYAHIIAGVRLGGGHDYQFTLHTYNRDFSPHALKAWRGFLRETYRTDQALAEAWGNTNARIDTAAIPSLQETSGADKTFFSRANIDYEIFNARQEWIVPEHFARIFKEEMGKDKLAVTWHMGQDNDHSYFLNSQWLDAAQPQTSYPMRMPGYSGGMTFVDGSYNLHGKLSLKELDTRTWLRSDGTEVMSMWLGTPLTEWQFHDLIYKELGQTLVQNQGYCYFDFTGGYRHPAIFETFRVVSDVNKRLVENRDDIRFRPETAVVFSMPSKHAPFDRGNALWRVDEFRSMCEDLRTGGVPLSFYDLADLVANPKLADGLKIIIFPQAIFLNTAERDFIDRVLKKNGRTLVWCYAAGCLDSKRNSVDGIRAASGIKVAASDPKQNQPFTVLSVPGSDPLGAGLPPLLGNGVTFNDAIFFGAGSRYRGLQRFELDDPEAVILGKYTGDGKPAVGVRRFADWTSVYCAAPGGLAPELLRNIALAAGVFVTADKPGLVIDMNDYFLSIHCVRGGKYRLNLPRTSEVTDILSGETVSAGTDLFEQEFTAQKTYWYSLKPTK